MKVCRGKCKQKKRLRQFYKNPNCADGHMTICISCTLKAIHAKKKYAPETSALMLGWKRPSELSL